MYMTQSMQGTAAIYDYKTRQLLTQFTCCFSFQCYIQVSSTVYFKIAVFLAKYEGCLFTEKCTYND